MGECEGRGVVRKEVDGHCTPSAFRIGVLGRVLGVGKEGGRDGQTQDRRPKEATAQLLMGTSGRTI